MAMHDLCKIEKDTSSLMWAEANGVCFDASREGCTLSQREDERRFEEEMFFFEK